jgi:hypothetical protein
MDVLELDQHSLVIIGLVVMRRIKERRLGPGPAFTRERAAQLGPTAGLATAQCTEISNDSVARPTGCPVGLNEDPVSMLLAAFAALTALEKHDAIEPPNEAHDRIRKRKINR